LNGMTIPYYSIWIIILLFGRGLFLGIVIPIEIPIHLRRETHIPLKKMRGIGILW